MKFSKLISWHAAFVNTFTLVFGGADELRPLTVLCFVYTLIGCSAISVCSRSRELFNNFQEVEARHNHNQSLGQNKQNKLPLANKSNRLVSSRVGFASLKWNGDGDICARPSTCSRAHVTLAHTHSLSHTRSQTGKLAGRRRLHLTRCHVAVVAAPTCLRPELDA